MMRLPSRLQLARVLVCALLGCTAATSHDSALSRQIATLPEQDMAVGSPTYYSITGGGLDALPPVFARLEQAASPGARFFLQLCAKQVLRKDYLLQHPEAAHVAWVERDHSVQMLAWWASQDEASCLAGDYLLPSVMWAMPREGQELVPPSAIRAEQLQAMGYVGQ